jgi:hypothetical protein
MADYIGTQSGNYSSGYLIANGDVSGAGNRLDIPQANYEYSGPHDDSPLAARRRRGDLAPLVTAGRGATS